MTAQRLPTRIFSRNLPTFQCSFVNNFPNTFERTLFENSKKKIDFSNLGRFIWTVRRILKMDFWENGKLLIFCWGAKSPRPPFTLVRSQIRLPDLKFVYQISKLGQIRIPDLKFVYQISKLGQIRLPDLKFVYQISKLGQIRLPDLKFVYQISKLGQIRLPDLKIRTNSSTRSEIRLPDFKITTNSYTRFQN